MYLMNRDGFSLLAMGFTGKEAVQWKLKYIEAFNQMEKQLAAQHKEQRAVQDANIQNAIDRVIEARKKLDENTAFLDECRKNREDSKAKYMQVKALCGEFKAIYGQHCDTVRTMENVVRGSQSFLTNAIDSLTIVAKGYPFYAALMDSLLDGLPAENVEPINHSRHFQADPILEAAGTVPQLRLPRSGSGRVHRHWPGHHERQDARTQPVDNHGDHCNV